MEVWWKMLYDYTFHEMGNGTNAPYNGFYDILLKHLKCFWELWNFEPCSTMGVNMSQCSKWI